MIVKKILFRVLGQKRYYRVVSKAFFLLYESGLLKLFGKFEYHYFVRDLVREGDITIDIGANMGYYTRIFAKKCGRNGHVYAVEPVSLFREILQKNVQRLSNITILPYALGEDEGAVVKMGIPDGMEKHRHGLTRILESDDVESNNNHQFKAIMHTPEFLFGKLSECNYIKCDVEGYEIYVIPLLEKTIEKHLPILQIETNRESRKVIIPLLKKYGYSPYDLDNKELIPFNMELEPQGDLFFLIKH
jgi:FkbM family methyltransferase